VPFGKQIIHNYPASCCSSDHFGIFLIYVIAYYSLQQGHSYLPFADTKLDNDNIIVEKCSAVD